ncbi:MAG: amidohydrolase family protein [Eudoraea sp.]|nr:amidohydrolase family protein [Eudoraea sp.]
MKRLLTILILSISVVVYSQDMKQPIIDIHLHGYSSIPPNVQASWAGESYAQELTSPQNTEMHLQMVIEEIEKNNIKLGVISSTSLEALTKWKATAPELFLSGIQTDELGQPILSPDSLKILFEKGEVDILGELGLQYFGLEPDVPMMAPYYKIAEENGIPVCLHTGLGPPGGPHSFAPKFRTTLGKPTLFEPILVKHPNLKAFLAHAGYPYIQETIAMMYIYPELYLDIGVLTWALPVEAFYSTLKHLMDAGFGRRIMFGSDQMMWPGAISIAVKTVEEAPFLSESEKRDILYNNAARFLELDSELISSHHK